MKKKNFLKFRDPKKKKLYVKFKDQNSILPIIKFFVSLKVYKIWNLFFLVLKKLFRMSILIYLVPSSFADHGDTWNAWWLIKSL